MFKRCRFQKWIESRALAVRTVPAVLVISAALSGCAVGNVGTLVAQVQQRGNVSELSVYSVGLHLRNRADDPGAHLGVSRRTYFFLADGLLAPGWYLLRAPLAPVEAMAQDLMTVGIDFTTAAPEAGLSLGYTHTRLLARVPLDASVLIEYGADLRVEKFTVLKQESTCAIP